MRIEIRIRLQSQVLRNFKTLQTESARENIANLRLKINIFWPQSKISVVGKQILNCKRYLVAKTAIS